MSPGGPTSPTPPGASTEADGPTFPGAGVLAAVGAFALSLARETGGIALVVWRATLALLPPRTDARELLRGLYRFGIQSVPIVVATAFLTGVIVVLQAAVYVTRYRATVLVGWATGFTTFREIGPVLIALMISGRVGSTSTAELATMAVTEQVDALRVLAVDPVAYLVIPRIFALVAVTFLLTVIGDVLAIAGGALSAKVLVGVGFSTFWASFQSAVHLADLTQGLVKSAVFGWAIGVVSCHFGLSARGGASAVGRAVTRAVVASAVAIFLLDYLVTRLLT